MIINVTALIIGCLMEPTPALLVCLPIFGPIVNQVGIDPLHFGIVLCLNLTIGMLTPPVGLGLYVMCSVAGVKFEPLTRRVLPFLGILIIRMLYIFNFIFRQDTLPIYLNESTNFNVSETEIGIYMGVVRFSTALSQLFLGTLTDRIGSKKMIISSLFLIGVTNIIMINITGTYPLYSLGLIQGISIAAANLSMMIYLISTMPKGKTGMVMGIYSEFENIGGLFSSPLIGMIYDNVSPSASVLFVTSIILSNSVLSVFLLRS